MSHTDEHPAGAVSTLDLTTFNTWLSITRLRAVGGVVLFALGLHALGVGRIALAALLAVCGGLLLVSAIGLLWRPVAARPRLFFHAQNLADLVGITLGIHYAVDGYAVDGLAALLFRPIYVLVIVPASLISVPSGLAVAAAASVGHELLLALERGASVATFVSLESLVPPFAFFLVAQQCFFYGAHLARKNIALAGLAAHLERSRQQLAAEHRMHAGLVEVARTLSSTLEPSELLARVNRITRVQLGADWSATFLVDPGCQTFRLAAVTDVGGDADEIGAIEFPLRRWPAVERLVTEPVVSLVGEEAGNLPGLFNSDRCLSTIFLAALRREQVLVGFLAVGYHTLAGAERERALDLLGRIAQHATIALHNARLLEEVRLASAMKSEFVGTISHELRSPLNVILGYLEMVLDRNLGPLTGEQADALARTQDYTLSLLEMITALLDLNRLEAGRLPLDRVPVVIEPFLEEFRLQLPESWQRPGVGFRVTVAPDLPVVDTDPGKLRTVVRNLVHNAFKFTERGEVTVAAGLTSRGDLAITVRDTGRGISAEAITYVFDMFRQEPGVGGGGVGLGLHIVRRFVDVLGGQVAVTSELGKGTCFVITLPCTAPLDGRSRTPAGLEEPAAAAA